MTARTKQTLPPGFLVPVRDGETDEFYLKSEDEMRSLFPVNYSDYHYQEGIAKVIRQYEGV